MHVLKHSVVVRQFTLEAGRWLQTEDQRGLSRAFATLLHNDRDRLVIDVVLQQGDFDAVVVEERRDDYGARPVRPTS